MGFSFFRRGRKAPPSLDIPECLPISQEHPTLLDLFSQEVGSASSASSWEIPDIINRRVEDASLTLQSSESNINCFEDASLGIRGGNMDEFDDVDPNDPDALDRYLNWIGQEYYDEQYILRQESQDILQSIHQVSPLMEARINPRITPQPFQQLHTQYPASVRGYLLFSCSPSPSVDDSSSDEEPDEFTSSTYRHRSFIVDSDSDFEDRFDPEENIAVTRIISRRGRILYDDGDVMCLWDRHNPDLSIANSSSLSSDSDFEDDEEADENLGDFQVSNSYNSSVISCFSPIYQIGSNMNDPAYDADTEDDFEARETMWNSNMAILQSSDLPDNEFIGGRGQVLDPGAHISASHLDNYNNSLDGTDNQVTESDFRSVSEDLGYRISRSFGVFDVLDSSATASSVHKDTTYELNGICAEQSMFKPTSIYNDDVHHQHDILTTEQHPFSPSSPAACNPFSSSFAWPPEPRDLHTRLQCPLEFNYSWISHLPCRSPVFRYYPSRPNPLFGVPSPAPPIFDWRSSCHPSNQIAVCPGPRPLRLIFGSGSQNQFAFTFTFTHIGLSFPPEGCICHFDVRCHMHPRRASCRGWYSPIPMMR